MRIVSLLVCAVVVVSSICILGRLALRACCTACFDPGRSLWDYDAWVIAPKWPFNLACASLFFNLQSTGQTLSIAWGVLTLFWVLIWFESLCAFRPLLTDNPADPPPPDKEYQLNKAPIDPDEWDVLD